MLFELVIHRCEIQALNVLTKVNIAHCIRVALFFWQSLGAQVADCYHYIVECKARMVWIFVIACYVCFLSLDKDIN